MWPSSKRRLYQDALDDYYINGTVNDQVQPFTKIEKLTTSKYKAPRMIQARHISFNLQYGRYIKPLELRITKNFRLQHHFGKGTPNQIAEKIWKLSNKWLYKTEGDHSTFDAHVTIEMLKLTHTYYQACYMGNAELNRLSKRTIVNKCKSRKGDRYKVKGTRMSGDVDTAFGNSIINIAILKELMSQLNIKGEVIVNGDDFILFTNKPVPIIEAQRILRTMNMDTKMKESTTCIHTVEFCMNKLVLSATGQPVLLKDIKKTFGKFGMTFTQVDNYRRYLMENLHGNWMMMKTTPLGICFKRLYYKTLQLEQNVIGNTKVLELESQHKRLEYKYLERNIKHNIKEALEDKEIDNNEITLSMILAFEESIELPAFEFRLYNRIKFFYTKYTNIGTKHLPQIPHNNLIVIDHNTKTIQTERR